MKARVVIDSNIYVSAIVFGGTPKSLLALAERGRFEICTSRIIRQEVERTLKEKFGWAQKNINLACAPLWAIAYHVESRSCLNVTDDPDDNHILECAVAGLARVIVTGDNDLLRLKSFESIEILKARAFLNRYEQ